MQLEKASREGEQGRGAGKESRAGEQGRRAGKGGVRVAAE